MKEVTIFFANFENLMRSAFFNRKFQKEQFVFTQCLYDKKVYVNFFIVCSRIFYLTQTYMINFFSMNIQLSGAMKHNRCCYRHAKFYLINLHIKTSNAQIDTNYAALTSCKLVYVHVIKHGLGHDRDYSIRDELTVKTFLHTQMYSFRKGQKKKYFCMYTNSF